MDKDLIKYITSVLRQGTIKWSVRHAALRRVSFKKLEGKYMSGKPKWKTYWKCDKCGEEFRNVGQLEVDHILEVGPFTGDWNTFISRMYCSLDNLQALCTICHMRKTNNFNATLRYARKPTSE